jgi:gamma-glutamylcyclotransferase (GGCT)/AIG2-like uncharacterized protein YtfP
MLYAAYGSNLNADDLARRSDLRLEPLGPAFLPDREAAFSHRSTSRHGGALDLRPRAGQLTPVMLFRVNEAERDALDTKEGHPNHYRRVDTVALTDDGREIPVFTYVSRRSEPFVPPADEYVEIVRRGLAAHGLPDTHLDAAARNEPIPWLADRLFAYGTLLRGESRHPIVERLGLLDLEPARAPGRLIHLGTYPGLLLADDPSDMVRGELLTLRDPSQALPLLDAVEGFYRFGAPDSLYRRALLRAVADSGSDSLTWTYIYNGDAAGARRIPSGDWRQRRGSA